MYFIMLACWLVFSVQLSLHTALADTDLIAYINGEGELYVVQSNGEGKRKFASGEMLQAIAYLPQQRNTGQEFYSWPVWSPNGTRIACFRMNNGEHGPTNGLYIFDAQSSQVL